LSWDIFAQDFPDVASVDDIPDDFEPRPIGTRDALTARIRAAIPEADFGDPAWGVIEGDGWSIEINIGENETCDGLALHVRDGGDGAVDAVGRILDAIGVRAIDSQTGAFFDRTAARESFAAWQAYRDHVVDTLRSDPPVKPGFFARLFGRR
jgi:hypothetical protein